MYPRYTEVENLNSSGDEMLKVVSQTGAETIVARVKDINDRWNKVVAETGYREVRADFIISYAIFN